MTGPNSSSIRLASRALRRRNTASVTASEGVLLSRSVALADGLVAFALLIGLQSLVAWLSIRWQWFNGPVKAEPTLLLRDGRVLEHTMRQQRITRAELTSAVRASGLGAISDAAAVVLETDGNLSVILASAAGDGPLAALGGVAS